MFSLLTSTRPNYSNDIVLIIAGASKKTFSVHKSTLSQSSRFLRVACSKNWKEGCENTVRLPSADVDAVIVYVHWLYSKDLDTDLMEDLMTLEASDKPTFKNLGKLWILGNFLEDNASMNATIDRFLRKCDALPRMGVRVDAVEFIWANTMEDCPLCKLVLDILSARFLEQTLVRKGSR